MQIVGISLMKKTKYLKYLKYLNKKLNPNYKQHIYNFIKLVKKIIELQLFNNTYFYYLNLIKNYNNYNKKLKYYYKIN